MILCSVVQSNSQTDQVRTPFCKKGKWGYIDANGKVVIKAKYQEARKFVDGHSIVKKENKYGVLSSYGKEVIAPKYDSVEVDSFYDERIQKFKRLYLTKLDSKYGFLSSTGVEYIAPKYDNVERLGRYEVLYLTKLDDKYGLSSAGVELVAPKYDSIELLGTMYDDNDEDYHEMFRVKLDGKYGVLSSDGKEVVTPKYDSIDRMFYESILFDFCITKLDGKYGVLSLGGEELIAPKFDRIESVRDGVCVTSLDGKYGLISDDGIEQIAPKYDEIFAVESGVYVTKLYGRYGLISSAYEEILSPCLLSLDMNKLSGSACTMQISSTSSGNRYVIRYNYNGKWSDASVTVDGMDSCYDEELFDLFQNKQIQYFYVTKNRLRNYIRWFESDAHNPYKIMSEDIPSFMYRENGRPNIEIEENGDIYTYPTVFDNTENGDNVVFYCSRMSPEDIGFFTIIHGAHYSTHLAAMNKIKIGRNIADIKTVFSPLFIKENLLQLLIPKTYLKNARYPNKLLLTIDTTYAYEPNVVYTSPKYEVFAGQLLEIDSGIHYDVPLYNTSHLCLIDTYKMTSKIFTLKGLSDISMKYDYQEKYIYIMNNTEYVKPEHWGDKGITAISQNQSPIYVASWDESSKGSIVIETAIVPNEGDAIIDIQRSFDGKYIFLCGSTTKHGYIGYENGIFIILKKNNNTFQEVARYRSKTKNKYYTHMIVLDDEHVYVEISDGDFDVLNINSIIYGDMKFFL